MAAQKDYFAPRDRAQNEQQLPEPAQEPAQHREGTRSVPAAPQDGAFHHRAVRNDQVPQSTQNVLRRPGTYMFPPNGGITQASARTTARPPDNYCMSQFGVTGTDSTARTERNNNGRGWIDDDYLEKNPWYGQGKGRPVFSLGQPLPRTVRGRNQQHRSRLPRQVNDDVEQGLGQDDEGKEADYAEPHRRPSAMTSQHDGPSQHEGASLHDGTSSDETLTKPEGGKETRDDEHEGTDMARKFQIDGDVLGQRDRDAVENGEARPNEFRNWWAIFRAKHPEPLAEFLCTGMSVFLGVAASLSVNLSAEQSKQYGSYETNCWAWGLSFMFGIYLGGGVSGAHMNPAISISLSIFRGFPWKQCAIYIVAQVLASIAGGAVAFGLFRDAILQVDPTMTTSYNSFFSVPQDWVSLPTAFFNQFAAGAVLMIAVLSLGDDENNPPGAGMHALILGLLITTLKMTLGYNTGAALSPACDLGPRLVALWGGYKTKHLFATNWWVIGPWAATIAGAIMGCILYDACVFLGSESPVNYRWSKRGERQKKWIWRRKGGGKKT